MTSNNIKEITQPEVIEKFGEDYKRLGMFEKDRLSSPATEKTQWFANEFTCAALYWSRQTKVRIKGTITRPEHRAKGHGSSMLLFLLEHIKQKSIEINKKIEVESYASDPDWYLNNGFNVKMKTPWGLTLVSKIIDPRGDLSDLF